MMRNFLQDGHHPNCELIKRW